MSEAESQLQGVAVIGMAGRFPGAGGSLERFWENLRDGVESISFFSEEELLAAGADPELLRHPAYVRAKGVLDGVEGFDAAFFGFTPREAELMDPQHRVLLECAWEALEDAGYDPERHGGRTAVYAGSGTSSYLFANLLPNPGLLETVGGLQALLLNDRDFLATRLSYKLGLKGPSVLVQTACSTGLVAVHMACQSLLAGESDLALAGAVSILLPSKEGYLYTEGGIASPDGHCRSFDASAGGSVAGNGAGVVVLKRVEEALADGDRIYAVIRGSAVNNDGSGKVGFTAPSIEGQAEVITESLLMANVEPSSIGYVEGHGSGTALGDPIEVAALNQAYGAAGGTEACALGSVKSNIGHLNTAAGLAGLFKAVMALRHATIPPSLHFEAPNTQCDLGPFRVPTKAEPWPAGNAGDGPRRAAVSSFGLGGTNVHVVVEEAPLSEPSEPSGPSRPWQLLTLSARTEAALDEASRRLADRLETEDLDLADVAFTLQMGRKAFAKRRAVVVAAGDRAAAVAALREGRGARGGYDGGERPVVFLLPGLGDQAVDLGRELYGSEPVFAAEIDRCAEILAPHLGADIREILFSSAPRSVEAPPAGPDLRAMLRRGEGPRDEASRRLARTEYAQPILFAVEHALARLLMAWGVQPQAMIGYSLGEYVAAALAGVLSLEDALALVAERAKLIQALPEGAMLAVPLPESEVRPLLGDGLSLSATNGPHFCVVGGPAEAVAGLESELSGRGVSCLRVTTTHAFHSRMMEPAAAALTDLARKVKVSAPRIPYVSNVTGTWITAADLADPGYWARHMVQPVRFAEGLAELLKDPARAMLEVGPGGTLSTLVRQHPAAASPVAVTTLGRPGEGSETALLLDAVGRLWTAGARYDPGALFGDERRHRVGLPTYPFERQRYWIDPPARGSEAARSALQPIPAGPREDVAEWFWAPSWKQAPLAAALPEPGADGGWLIFLDDLDDTGLGERIAERLRGEGRRVEAVDACGFATAADYGSLLKRLADEGGVPANLIHLRGVTAAEPAPAEARAAGLLGLVLLEQALTGAGGDAGLHVTVVANGLHEVLEGDPVHPAKAEVLGAVRVLHQESARLTCATVDVALPVNAPALDRLAGQIVAEAARGAAAGGSAVAYRGRQRWVRDFEPVPLPEVDGSLLADGAAYLVTDGLHGAGAALAGYLVRERVARVALAMPPEFPDRERWEGWTGLPDVPPGQDVVTAAVRRLAGLDPDRIAIVRGADPAAVLAAAREAVGSIQGVFHTAGAFTGGLIQLKDPAALAASLDPATRGAEAWLAALEAAPEPPAFVLLMGSTLAFTGGLGQLDLAAAGTFLDALAQRRSQGEGPRVVAAHWDPYQWDGWLIAAAAGGIAGVGPEEIQKNLETWGIPAAKSGEALRRLLAADLPRAVVASRDVRGMIAEADSVTAETLLAQMGGAHGGEKAPRPALSTTYAEPRDERERALAALWEELFGIAPIGLDDSFLELGGHSLLAIQMVTQVRSRFGADLPVTVLFESPTVAELSKAVGRALGEESEADLEALLALVEGLSPEEAAKKLAEMGVEV